jgi:P pilus assembly chaperone PapD
MYRKAVLFTSIYAYATYACALSQEEKGALAMCFCLVVVELVLLLFVGAEDRTTFPMVPMKIASLTWNDNNAVFAVINTGTRYTTIVKVRVNDEYATMNPSSVTLYPGDQTTITVTKTGGFISGVVYEFRFITARGNAFFYTATAP